MTTGKKRKESLEEGLDKSANKRGFSGAKRHQYIGGALRNMQKKGQITLKKRQAKPKQAGLFGAKYTPPKKKARPRRKK